MFLSLFSDSFDNENILLLQIFLGHLRHFLLLALTPVLCVLAPAIKDTVKLLQCISPKALNQSQPAFIEAGG